MFRKALLGCLAIACVAGTAAAQAESVDLEVSGEFLTKYIWNGFDRIRSLGLDTGPVLQPRVSVGMGNSPLRAFVGGSFVVNDDSELHETTYGVQLERFASPFSKFGIGYIYYDDRVPPAAGFEDADSHEIWAALEVRNAVGMKTKAALKYELSAHDAFEPFFFAVGEVGYTFPLVPMVGATGVGLDLTTTTSLLYNTKVEQAGIETVGKGLSAWQVGVSATLKAARVQVTPSAHYQVTLEDSVNDENPFWAGVSVAYAF